MPTRELIDRPAPRRRARRAPPPRPVTYIAHHNRNFGSVAPPRRARRVYSAPPPRPSAYHGRDIDTGTTSHHLVNRSGARPFRSLSNKPRFGHDPDTKRAFLSPRAYALQRAGRAVVQNAKYGLALAGDDKAAAWELNRVRRYSQRFGASNVPLRGLDSALVNYAARRQGLRVNPQTGDYFKPQHHSLLDKIINHGGVDKYYSPEAVVRANPFTARQYGFRRAPLPSNPKIDVQYRNQGMNLSESPVIKALAQTTRPLHAIAGSINALQTGKDPWQAAKLGIENKRQVTFSDVLKHAGASKGLAAAVGFPLDVLADPTTYVTAGTVSIGRKAALDAAASAARDVSTRVAQEAIDARVATETSRAIDAATARASRRGRTLSSDHRTQIVEAVARRHGASARGGLQGAAASRATRAVGHNDSGVAIKFAGRRVPGVQRATTSVARGARRAAGASAARRDTAAAALARRGRFGAAKAISRQPANAVRDMLSLVAPDVRPSALAHITPEQWATLKAGERRARVAQMKGVADAERIKAAIRGSATHEELMTVRTAIEHGTTSKLEPRLRTVAKQLTDLTKFERRQAIRSGSNISELQTHTPEHAQGYVPRVPTAELEGTDAFAMGGKKIGSRNPQAAMTLTRKERRPVDVVNAEKLGHYVEDLPYVYAKYVHDARAMSAKARLNRALEQIGRPVRRPEQVVLHKGEALYRVRGSRLEEVASMEKKPTPAVEAQIVHDLEIGGASGKDVGGRYFVADQKLVKRAYGQQQVMDRNTAAVLLDRSTGGFKRLATATPGFHARNLMGDTQNAYLAQSAPRLARNFVHAARAVKTLSGGEKVMRTLGKRLDPSGKGLTIKAATGVKQHITYAQLVREAVDAGAVRAGFMARELPELLAHGPRIAKTQGRKLAAVQRWMNNREDLVRFATYIGSRERGLTADQAAARTARYHFDYGDLSPLERGVLRRLFPFYTFSARNIPLQAKTFLKKPGKYATYQKAIEEASKLAGLPNNWQGNLSDYAQSQAPIPVRIGGKVHPVALSLPLNDLDTSAALLRPSATLGEITAKIGGLTNPIIKDPIELWTNYNTFFRSPIQSKESPLVPAPSWVGALPDRIKHDLGVTNSYLNKRTGKKSWGWYGRSNYIAHVVPGAANFLINVAAAGSASRGRGWVGKTASILTGLKPDTYDATSIATTKMTRLYDQQDKLTTRRSALNQQGIHKANATAEYNRLGAQLKHITAQIGQLSRVRGDKIPKGSTSSKGSSAKGWGSAPAGSAGSSSGSSGGWGSAR